MGTEILYAQDCLKDRFPSDVFRSTMPSKTGRNSPGNQSRSSRKKRRCPVGSAGKENRDFADPFPTVVKFPVGNLVMGQVTILKRGVELKNPKKLEDEKKTKIDEEKNAKIADEEKKAKINDKKKEIFGDDEDSDLLLTDRLGPDPEMVRKEIRVTDLKSVAGLYAGSAYFTSPSPSSLPLPSFFSKKEALSKNGDNDLASKGLRRLLRLDLP